jgi:hypothetical protein
MDAEVTRWSCGQRGDGAKGTWRAERAQRGSGEVDGGRGGGCRQHVGRGLRSAREVACRYVEGARAREWRWRRGAWACMKGAAMEQAARTEGFVGRGG